MAHYKYLLWDVDGTILNFLAAEKAAIKTLFERFGLGVCTDEMIGRYSVINDRYWKALERGEMTKQEILVERFREFFGSEGLDASVAEAFNAEYQLALGDTIVFCDQAEEMLAETKEKYVIAAITNGTLAAQKKKLSLSGLNQVFDYIFISEEIGVEKPNKAFFDYVFSAMGIQNAKEVLVIGDSLTSDICGGIQAGCDTCWYDTKMQRESGEIVPDYRIENLGELRDILKK